MAYHVYVTDRDQAYLESLPLSEAAKGKLDQFIEYALANVTDSFRTDPDNRPQLGARFFQADFILLDSQGDGRYHKITFMVSDEHAASGVLLIVYVDHQ